MPQLSTDWWFNIPVRPLLLWRTSSWHSVRGRDLIRNAHTIYAYNPVCGRDCTYFTTFFSYRYAQKGAETSERLCNVLQRTTCLPSVLSQGMRPEICHQVALFTFPLDQSRLQQRQAPAIEHNTTQDVCLPRVYLCLCDEVGKSRSKAGGTLRNRGKLKVTVRAAHEVPLKKTMIK